MMPSVVGSTLVLGLNLILEPNTAAQASSSSSSQEAATTTTTPGGLRRGLVSELALEHKFCWKHTTTRGIGMIPGCPDGKVQLGGLCYSPCRPGFKRFGVDCHQTCPQGFRDDGLFCRKAEYGRGGGYMWRMGDIPFDTRGMIRRCEADHGIHRCEVNGFIAYPKCLPGYYNVMCCICRPEQPDCAALGFAASFDLSCAKTIQMGDPTLLTQCPPGWDYDSGLCYPKCGGNNYDGVGPVCWGTEPDGWVSCGFGAARTPEACEQVIHNQIRSVFDVAFGIAHNTDSGSDWNLIDKFRNMVQALENVLNEEPALRELVERGRSDLTLEELDLLESGDVTDPAEIAYLSSKIAALFDPTGISGIITSFSFPTCDQISNTENPTRTPTKIPSQAPSPQPTVTVW